MPKINQEEYEILKDLDDKWKWIARDKDNTLVMGAGKSERYLDRWFPPVNVGDSLVVDETNAVKDISEYGNLFQFIQWEDEEPYNIAELIREYEHSAEHVSHVVNERVKALGKAWSESEETEVKDLEWLENEVRHEYNRNQTRFVDTGNERYADRTFAFGYVLQLIKQLDEQEITYEQIYDFLREDSGLSVKSFDYYWNCIADAVEIDEPGNLLVPKQDRQKDWAEFTEFLAHERIFSHEDKEYIVIEKPVIPQFVANVIEKNKGDGFKLIDTREILNQRGFVEDIQTLEWVRETTDNNELFARAWLDGYTVEEPKYYVKDNKGNRLLRKVIKGFGIDDRKGKIVSSTKAGEASDFRLTEQEIKDYDPRYWAFRKPVEELEE